MAISGERAQKAYDNKVEAERVAEAKRREASLSSNVSRSDRSISFLLFLSSIGLGALSFRAIEKAVGNNGSYRVKLNTTYDLNTPTQIFLDQLKSTKSWKTLNQKMEAGGYTCELMVASTGNYGIKDVKVYIKPKEKGKK